MPADKQEVRTATEWTFTKTGGGLRTVSLLPFDTVLRPVNVVPSVQGILTADNIVKLECENLSEAWPEPSGLPFLEAGAAQR